jgi:hypothetical protein
LDRELKIDVGVVAEKRVPRSQWIDELWVPVAVVVGETGFKPGARMMGGEGFTRYFVGHAQIYCHATETEAYVHNLDSREPALYVVLRKDEDGPLPWMVHAVTASPYEAQDYEDSAEDLIERVAMPHSVLEALVDFVEAHHVDRPFKKRKRKEIRLEEQKFGKDPIFVTGKPRRGNGEDV